MKIVRLPTFICLIYSLIVPIILLVIFCLLLLASKHNSLLVSTFNAVVPKSMVVTLFFVLNFIFITSFIGSTCTPPEEDHFEYLFCFLPPLMNHEMERTTQEDNNRDCCSSDHDEDDRNYRGYDGCDEGSDRDDMDTDCSSDDSEDDDNELEKRIEEFIAGVYKKRKEEFLTDRASMYIAGS